MLPPAFVEYALRGGADGVLVATCRSGGCDFRLGERWTSERLLGQREPHLRRTVPPSRLQLLAASAHDERTLANALAEFRTRLEALPAAERPTSTLSAERFPSCLNPPPSSAR
jgi:coenzyme F420-reducing hydrogenase delta subunit